MPYPCAPAAPLQDTTTSVVCPAAVAAATLVGAGSALYAGVTSPIVPPRRASTEMSVNTAAAGWRELFAELVRPIMTGPVMATFTLPPDVQLTPSALYQKSNQLPNRSMRTHAAFPGEPRGLNALAL
ncbi:MAG TPA: hypothetical protein VEA69_13835 [Tepidisphaeraceae bacterium]|nr:hypothetical protein [Tepidisphaeraceae bacterium]